MIWVMLLFIQVTGQLASVASDLAVLAHLNQWLGVVERSDLWLAMFHATLCRLFMQY